MVAVECINIQFLIFYFSIGLIINTTYVQVGDGYSGAGAGPVFRIYGSEEPEPKEIFSDLQHWFSVCDIYREILLYL